jgi:hypothetical protein
MTGKERFKKLVDEGREGKNIGLSIGSPKLGLYMDDYLPGVSYLIGGNSGTGKSTFTLEKFIYNPLQDFLNDESKKDRDPYWIIFSLEMTMEQVYAKLCSMYIYDKYGIQLRFKEIFSRGKDCIISEDNYNIIQNEIDEFLDVLDKRLIFHEGTLTEEVYLTTMNTELKRFGKFVGNTYEPYNSQQIIGALIDHCSLVKASNGRTKKEEMDAISRDSVIIRNKTRIVSPIHVSQFNRSSNSDERLKQSKQTPTASDYKDSGSIYEDSMCVFALFSPHQYSLNAFHSYNIKVLEQNFIAVYLLKSRFGTSDIWVPFGYYGDCGRYFELPRPETINDWDRYKYPEWKFKEDMKNEEEISDNGFKFKM